MARSPKRITCNKRAAKQGGLSKVVEYNGDGLNNFMVGSKGFEERANHGQNVAPKDHEPMQNISNENFKWWRNEIRNQIHHSHKK